MLAAASQQTQSLELVKLILGLIRSKTPDIPDGFQRHLLSVIEQAKLIARDPKAVQSKTSPDAIRLAVAMRSRPDLASVLEAIHSFDNIGPEVAKRMLSEMEQDSAS